MKHALRSFIASCAFGIAASTAHASALEQFKQFVSSTQSAKGEFSQRLVKSEKKGAPADAAAKASAPSTGTFIFARPGKFIWTYLKPYEQLLQADGDKLYMQCKQITAKLPNVLLDGSSSIWWI